MTRKRLLQQQKNNTLHNEGMTMKKLTKIAALTALMMGGQAFAAQDNPVKIAVLMYGMKAEFVQLMEKSAKEHPAVKNGEAIITVYDGRYDPMVQNNQAETAIQTKADAIIINPMDYEANIDVVTMANDAKIRLSSPTPV